MSKVALVYGVFDLTHLGHYRLFKALYYKGYDVCVGVVNDEFVETYKRKPMMNQEERLENVSHCKWVKDCFISNGSFTKEAYIISPDVIAHGNDWDEEDYKKHMGYTDRFLEQNNIEIITLPYTEGVSTTKLIKRIREEDRK